MDIHPLSRINIVKGVFIKSKTLSKNEFNTAPVKIGNNVWTGANCIILKGVTIGDNSIIGAGCVIYKDVPANSIIINKQELLDIKNRHNVKCN